MNRKCVGNQKLRRKRVTRNSTKKLKSKWINYPDSDESPDSIFSNEDDFEIEILGAHSIEGSQLINGKCFFLVLWVTENGEYYSWEPMEKFDNAGDLLDFVDDYNKIERRMFKNRNSDKEQMDDGDKGNL